MFDHTPGPWKIGTPPPNGEQTIGTDKGLMVATATTGYINTKANARLIAAAPEMLDALIEGIKRNEKKGTPQESMYVAVEKATGKPISEILNKENQNG